MVKTVGEQVWTTIYLFILRTYVNKSQEENTQKKANK